MSKNEHLKASIYDYLIAHNPPLDDLLRDLVEETAAMGPISGMQLGDDQTAFLGFMVGLLQARFVVEIGTFTGMSSIAMARALPAGGRILCCDIDEDYTAVARRYWERAGIADRIDLVLGPAVETLADLPRGQKVDMALIDADKENYISYYEALMPRLSSTGA